MVGFAPEFLFVKLREIAVNGASYLSNRNMNQTIKLHTTACISVFTISVIVSCKISCLWKEKKKKKPIPLYVYSKFRRVKFPSFAWRHITLCCDPYRPYELVWGCVTSSSKKSSWINLLIGATEMSGGNSSNCSGRGAPSPSSPPPSSSSSLL